MRDYARHMGRGSGRAYVASPARSITRWTGTGLADGVIDRAGKEGRGGEEDGNGEGKREIKDQGREEREGGGREG